MTAALTPDEALALVATLTPGLRRAAVLDAGGTCLAGAGDLAVRAHRTLEAGPDLAVRTQDGLHVVRDDRHAVAAEVGEEVLGGLLLADLRAALATLRAG